MKQSSKIAAIAKLCLLCGAAGLGLSSLGCGSDPPAPRAVPQPAEPDAAEEPSPGAKDEVAIEHVCNVCGSDKGFKTGVGRKLEVCKECSSKGRHRLLAHFLEHETPLFTDKLDVLHFGPNPGLISRLQKLENLNYATADILDERADHVLDITAIDLPDESWDYVIVYHVLEHIVDDKKAMRELFRILRPGGKVILQVPLWPGRTEIYEDPAITDWKERKRHFGQGNHVRKYAAKGLQERLEATGFEVEVIDYLGRLDQALIQKHSLRADFKPPMDQSIWVATRPKPAAQGDEPAPAGDEAAPAPAPQGDEPAPAP